MDGARTVFLSAGFDGASMNDIARAAGVSKGTLYAYFDSKEQLFEALIREDRSQQAERLCAFPADASDPGGQLRAFGRRLIEMMTRPETIAHVRVVIAATAKFPRLGRAFYEAGPRLRRAKARGAAPCFRRLGRARNRRYGTSGAPLHRPLPVRRPEAAAVRRRRLRVAERDRRRGRRPRSTSSSRPTARRAPAPRPRLETAGAIESASLALPSRHRADIEPPRPVASNAPIV